MNDKTGAIALVGSGEYLPQMQELETMLLHRAISVGKNNSYVQIPTGAGKEGADSLEYWRKRGQDQVLRIGSECIYLPIINRDDAFKPEFISRIKGAGLIYFSGGDPSHIAEVFRNTPLWDAIIGEWESGSSLAGCSAGAMAFCGKIIGIRRSQVTEGLNLLPGLEVIPHYDKFLGWLPDRVTAAVIREDADTTLLGIDEDTALYYTDSWHKFGRGKVHVLRGTLDYD